ncbi:MAG TPA: hypothetical protein VFJ91_11310 [Gaiellaceae bacterium]|nr:hypothetical protein [Gaiellaceae bacterium]
MRRAASALLAAAAVLAAAGCGSGSPKVDRTFAQFLASPQGATWANRFPHQPGSRPCTAHDPKLDERVPATCSTALSLGDHKLVVATFTVSWSHGSRARTWFVFLRRGGEVDHVTREGAPG